MIVRLPYDNGVQWVILCGPWPITTCSAYPTGSVLLVTGPACSNSWRECWLNIKTKTVFSVASLHRSSDVGLTESSCIKSELFAFLYSNIAFIICFLYTVLLYLSGTFVLYTLFIYVFFVSVFVNHRMHRSWSVNIPDTFCRCQWQYLLRLTAIRCSVLRM